jgi:hypothetical protein
MVRTYRHTGQALPWRDNHVFMQSYVYRQPISQECLSVDKNTPVTSQKTWALGFHIVSIDEPAWPRRSGLTIV